MGGEMRDASVTKDKVVVDVCVALAARKECRDGTANRLLQGSDRVIEYLNTHSDWVQMVASPSMRREYIWFGTNPELMREGRPGLDLLAFFGNLCRRQQVVCPQQAFEGCSKPRENNLFATALAADARWLITGDRSLLDMRQVGETRVVTPHDFLETQLDEVAARQPALPVRKPRIAALLRA